MTSWTQPSAYDTGVAMHARLLPSNPIDDYAVEWDEPKLMRMIGPCSRAGWPDTEITNPSDKKRSKCTEEQKAVFTQLQAYASSRPLGSPGFRCYSRRKTGTNLDLKTSLFKRGHVITEWKKQLISASPPNKSVTSDHCISVAPLNNWGQGKCFEITVPENATYVSFEPKYAEIVFPVGCVFEVISDEQPGKPIKVMLNQDNVKRGSFGWVQEHLTTNQWWNGVVKPIHLAGKFWKEAYIKTPGGITTNIAVSDPAIRQRVRDDFEGSTIVLVEPLIKDLDWIKSEIYGMVALMPLNDIRFPPNYGKDTWLALGGVMPFDKYALQFEFVNQPAAFLDLAVNP